MYSIIIPSRNPDNLVPCVRAIRQHEPQLAPAKIIVVDDGARAKAQAQLPGVTWLAGIKPFTFARNVNLGIAAAGEDDVILLNDDAVLKTPRGFSRLAQSMESASGWGVISAVTNCAGNPNQYRRGGQATREERNRSLAFVCVLVPRRTITRVGLLDERFTAYGWEDNDYCLRVRQDGLKLGIFDGCFVDHLSLTSTFRGKATAPGLTAPGRRIFEDKWGVGAV